MRDGKLTELWGDLHYPGRRYTLRAACCNFGLHWPVEWSERAHPGSYDPPEPPEPDWCCGWCGQIRLPYRKPFWYVGGWFWAFRNRVVLLVKDEQEE